MGFMLVTRDPTFEKQGLALKNKSEDRLLISIGDKFI